MSGERSSRRLVPLALVGLLSSGTPLVAQDGAAGRRLEALYGKSMRIAIQPDEDEPEFRPYCGRPSDSDFDDWFESVSPEAQTLSLEDREILGMPNETFPDGGWGAVGLSRILPTTGTLPAGAGLGNGSRVSPGSLGFGSTLGSGGFGGGGSGGSSGGGGSFPAFNPNLSPSISSPDPGSQVVSPTPAGPSAEGPTGTPSPGGPGALGPIDSPIPGGPGAAGPIGVVSPEPASAALFASGLIALLAARRRKAH